MIDADFRREYAAGTEGAGMISLANWTTVRVTGGDRATFLHNMCTNDVKAVAPGGGCEAFFTDVKGKTLAHAFVLVADEEILLVTVPAQAVRLIDHLDRYIIREDVRLAEISRDIEWLIITGRHSGLALGQLDLASVASLAGPWSHSPMSVAGANVRVVRCELPWCGGYLVGVPSDQLETVRGEMERVGILPCSPAIWHAIRVESSWPLWGVDFDDANLPQEVNRDNLAIHFRKGCYLGQETVARIDALGHVNKKLVQVRFGGTTVPADGAEITVAGQSAGRITSAAWSPRWQAPVALATLRRGANHAGQVVDCCGQGGSIVGDNAG